MRKFLFCLCIFLMSCAQRASTQTSTKNNENLVSQNSVKEFNLNEDELCSFIPNTNGSTSVYTMGIDRRLKNGKIAVEQRCKTKNNLGSTPFILRLNSDFSIDKSFTPFPLQPRDAFNCSRPGTLADYESIENSLNEHFFLLSCHTSTKSLKSYVVKLNSEGFLDINFGVDGYLELSPEAYQSYEKTAQHQVGLLKDGSLILVNNGQFEHRSSYDGSLVQTLALPKSRENLILTLKNGSVGIRKPIEFCNNLGDGASICSRSSLRAKTEVQNFDDVKNLLGLAKVIPVVRVPGYREWYLYNNDLYVVDIDGKSIPTRLYIVKYKEVSGRYINDSSYGNIDYELFTTNTSDVEDYASFAKTRLRAQQVQLPLAKAEVLLYGDLFNGSLILSHRLNVNNYSYITAITSISLANGKTEYEKENSNNSLVPSDCNNVTHKFTSLDFKLSSQNQLVIGCKKSFSYSDKSTYYTVIDIP